MHSPNSPTRSATPSTPRTSFSDYTGSCNSSQTDFERETRFPDHALLPYGYWIDASVLKTLQAAKPAVVARCAASVQCEIHESRHTFIERALGVAQLAGFWDSAQCLREEKVEVVGRELIYYTSVHKETAFVSDTIVDEPIIAHAKALRAFSLASLHVIANLLSHCSCFAIYFLEPSPTSFQPIRGSLVIPAPISVTQPATKGSEITVHDEGGFAIDDRPFGVPTPSEWRELWAIWDLITVGMIPQNMLLHKPIDLRHKCLFYLGHIPTFLDMLLSKAIGGAPTEPAYFWNIFERGIDPHVDDPENCLHSHSDVPKADADWPSLEAVLDFRDAVRARLLRVYGELVNESRPPTPALARVLVMALEHEGFHVETLLYMLIQCAGTGMRPPSGFTPPPWTLLASQWDNVRAPDMPMPVFSPTTVVLGWDDQENEDLGANGEAVLGHAFGWDNESPQRMVTVGAFRAEWRPVSNGEYLRFWETSGRKADMPKSWVEEDEELKVRTVYGPVPMAIATCWPVLASYDDLAEYALAKGGRLPTEPELRLFLDTFEVGHEGGGNVGFRNWHPIPSTTGFGEHDGKGSNGGVWEWTSTLFDRHDGLVPTKLFPGYSVDFFDRKHHVVLGGSYATIPRLAGRRTLRNFYQHNYPYAWVGARVVYDV